MKKQIPAELEKQLMELGLTSYQSKVYRAVYTLKECSISQIANYSKVPTAKIYSVVNDLKAVGLLAEIPRTRPVIFKAFSPDQYIQTEINRVAEIGEHIKQSLETLKKFSKEEDIAESPQTLLIENELLIKNLLLKELKTLPQNVLFIIHHDFDFYEQVLLRLDRAIGAAPESKVSVTIIDPYERNLDELLQIIKHLEFEIISPQDLPHDLIESFKNIPFLFIIDEKNFINISQTEQSLNFLFIKSRNFSEFLSSILKNLHRTE